MESPPKLIDSSKAVKLLPINDHEGSISSLHRTKQEDERSCKSALSAFHIIPKKSYSSSLRDIPNPASLVSLKFTNRGISSIPDIALFKNIVTELPDGIRSIRKQPNK